MKDVIRKLSMTVSVMSIVMLMGCLVAPVVPPRGGLYSNTNAPLDIDVDNTKVTGKRGEASSYCILGLVSYGDASIKAAADNGGITTVEHADYKFLNVLFFYQKFTTVVYGQ